MLPATCLICSATFSAAFTTAAPEMYVVDEAYAPTSNGVKSVSLEYMMMSSSGTPSTSAAIWPNTVSDPVPRSVAPTRQLNDPSSFILIDAAPISRYGMAVPCITQAIPMPLRSLGLPGTVCQSGLPNFRAQSIDAAPCSTHCGSAQVLMISGRGSRPSLHARLNGCSSPARTMFFKRNSIGSIADFARDAFHVDIHRERALRHAVTPIGPGGRRVGVHDVGIETNVGNGRIAFGRLAGV